MSDICIIFDLDGTLIDSESLAARALADLIPELCEPIDILVDRYRGIKVIDIVADLERRLEIKLKPEFKHDYHQRVFELLKNGIDPLPGVDAMLRQLARPKCVASNAPPEKIAKALELSQLADHFGNKTYSAYVVGRWKPSPDLFLYAAREMGYSPQKCVVVEDSLVGLQAAKTAGMTAVMYASTEREPHSESDFVLSDMAKLPQLLDSIARSLL